MSLVAIIDIGSISVGGALVNLPRKKISQRKAGTCVEIIKSVRHEAAIQENLDVRRFLAGMDTALKETLVELELSGQGRPSRVICFLSSPFHASQTRLITHTETKPFTVTPKLVANLMAAELEKFKQTQKDLFARRGDHGHEVVENKIIQIKLNGYPTATPYRQRASEIAISNFISFTSKDVIDRFRNLIIGGWHQTRLEWHSFAFTFFNILNELLGTPQDFLLLDIGGEITELSLSWQGLLWNTASFPSGRNFVARELAREFATTGDEAYSSLKLYQSGHHRLAAAEKMAGALGPIKEKWLAAFRQSLSRVVDRSFLPANIYLVGDLDILPLFKEWLAEESFDSFAISNKKFSVNIIAQDWIDRFCHHGPSVARDLSLMVEAIFCDKLVR